MKKTILSLATVALFSISVSMAQRTYNPNAGHPNAGRPDAPFNNTKSGSRIDDVKGNNNPKPGSRMDDIKEDININKLDAIVNLSRKQEKELKRIEDRYDTRENFGQQRRHPQMVQRLQAQKQQEMLDVLNKKQLQQWIAFQHSNRYDRSPVYGRR